MFSTVTESFRRTAVFVLFLLIGITTAVAQQESWEKQGSWDSHPRPLKRSAALAYLGPQPFDMVHYDLDLRFAMVTAELSGTVTMTLVPNQMLTAITLNEVQLQLDTIRVNGTLVLGGVTYAGETFTIPLPIQALPGDTMTVAITYHRPPSLPRPTSRQGYYYFVPDTSGLRSLPDTLGYTMSEPSDARFWMPCYDEPWDKATLDFRSTVPAGFTVASNGVLVEKRFNQDGTVTWHWRENHQIAPYLMAATISKWALSSLSLGLTSGDTIPVQYYVWRPDSAQCAAYLPTVATMISNLGRLFGPYPFDKYGMTGVVPFLYGGMEHQTITTLARSVETHEFVVVHELGHQWWGDNVTCGTWADIWLNEGFASYVEALWTESINGPNALSQYMTTAQQNFAYGSWQGAVYDPQDQGFGDFPTSVYSKGSWALHMLRGILGDSIFFSSLRAYRARYEGGAATTDEFRAVVDSVSRRDMRWFFNEWIYGKGWPRYAFRSQYASGQLTLTIYQQQDTAWQTFSMPIQIRASVHGEDTLFTVLDSSRVQTFSMPLSFAPDSVAFDPGSWILKQMVSAPTGIAMGGRGVPEEPMLEQNFPNPFNPTTGIRYQVTGTSTVKLVVYDVLGRQVSVLVNEKQAPGNYEVKFDGANMASGVYYYRLTTGNYVASRSMVLIR